MPLYSRAIQYRYARAWEAAEHTTLTHAIEPRDALSRLKIRRKTNRRASGLDAYSMGVKGEAAAMTSGTMPLASQLGVTHSRPVAQAVCRA